MKNSIRWTGLALVLCLPLAAQAHRQWMLPSATVLSGEKPWVTVDAAVSNDLFYFEHRPMRLDGIQVIAPSGTVVPVKNTSTGEYRSTFDVQLQETGTYKIVSASDGLNAMYKENGQPRRWRGTPEAFAKEVPATAQDLQVTQGQNRLEVFVTAGKPSTEVLKPTGKGLELVPVTHPNDLFAGETAKFRFTIDGQPAADLKLAVVPGGIRYRDKLNEMNLTTDKNGEVGITWPEPGMYWINATYSDNKAAIPQARERRASYTATLEVLAP